MIILKDKSLFGALTRAEEYESRGWRVIKTERPKGGVWRIRLAHRS